MSYLIHFKLKASPGSKAPPQINRIISESNYRRKELYVVSFISEISLNFRIVIGPPRILKLAHYGN